MDVIELSIQGSIKNFTPKKDYYVVSQIQYKSKGNIILGSADMTATHTVNTNYYITRISGNSSQFAVGQQVVVDDLIRADARIIHAEEGAFLLIPERSILGTVKRKFYLGDVMNSLKYSYDNDGGFYYYINPKTKKEKRVIVKNTEDTDKFKTYILELIDITDQKPKSTKTVAVYSEDLLRKELNLFFDA